MGSSSRRSSSLQRGTRPGSAKRGQRAITPSRRLSDLQERPAWDATSSNLDKFKLTTEQQERRKASLVSKHRPLASDSKQCFVEAWAKQVTAGVLKADNERDQDRPRSSPGRGELSINYSSVVDMIKKSPAGHGGSTIYTPSGLACSPSTASAREQSQECDPSHIGGSSRDEANATSSHIAAIQQPTRTTAAGNVSSTAPPSPEGSRGADTKLGAVRGVAGENGVRNEGEGRDGGVRQAAVRRGEVNVTPVADALRPRTNPADATTIIAFGSDSDAEDEDQEDRSPGGQAPSRPTRGDPLAAAFEAAFLGHGYLSDAPAHGIIGGMPLTWATSHSGASPLNTAAGDVERRLRAVEAAVSSSAGGGAHMVQEELAELRLELRRVQQDNVKLRQELSAFSTHTSTLLTQLQAQVQQLLRPSVPGATTAVPPQPYVRQAAQPYLPGAAIPTTISSAAIASGPFAGLGASVPEPQLPQQAVHKPVLQQQPMARRNIFADLDISINRPAGQFGNGVGGGGAGYGGTTPMGACGQPTCTKTVTSPLIDVDEAPYTMRPVPTPRNIEDAEVALPSFAAFRRAAGAAAFTSARPGSEPPAVSPSVTAATASSKPATARDGDGPSPLSGHATLQPRPFPTQYQPRSLGGVLARAGPPLVAQGVPGASVNVMDGAYCSAVANTAAFAAATASPAAAVHLAQTHAGMPQPVVFSVGPEFRTARASGLSAENSMSLSAHMAAAAAMRSKASVHAPGTGH